MSRSPRTEAAAAARRVAVLREQTPEHRRPPVDAAELASAARAARRL